MDSTYVTDITTSHSFEVQSQLWPKHAFVSWQIVENYLIVAFNIQCQQVIIRLKVGLTFHYNIIVKILILTQRALT